MESPDSKERGPPGIPASSFAGLDFSSLWKGRERTTLVESELVQRALGEGPIGRLLELGTGNGRLSSQLQARANEYVGADRTPEFLRELRGDSDSSRPPRLAAADGYRLPFREAAFDAVVMVRVYNFLERPTALLQEIRRVLGPDGLLVFSCDPRPSIATLVADVKWALADRRGEPFRFATFARQRSVRIHPSSFPTFAPNYPALAEDIAAAGFRVDRVWSSGLEDYLPFRSMPARFSLTLATALRPIPFLPTLFVRVRPGRVDGRPRQG
ncbi:MAG: class I SAM-dependent methyltransferase [Thermoplasmata archaeon]|nr:class I SAM-dependent methyltransferase [Thermoplasmata archaeon]